VTATKSGKAKGTLLFTADGWRIQGKCKSAHATYSTAGNSNVPFPFYEAIADTPMASTDMG